MSNIQTTANRIAILEPLVKHPGGQFWANELIQSANAGLCGWDEVKPYMHRVSVAAIQAAEKRKTYKWEAGQIMVGSLNKGEDDYGSYLLID